MEEDKVAANKKKMKRIFLFFNVALLAVGQCAGPLVMRLYFLQGGNRIWLSSTLTTVGCPLNLIPLLVTYFQRRQKASVGPTNNRAHAKAVLMDGRTFLAAAVVGIVTGADNYLYAYGVSKLPVSTGALIIASQLAFTALFAFLLVGQKLTAFSINAVFLLTLGAGVLALRSSSDRPEGETKKEYYVGFVIMVAGAVLFGLILPLVEWTYKQARQAITYTLVLEIQLVLCFFATVVTVIGMIVNKDFKAYSREYILYRTVRNYLDPYRLSLSNCSIFGLTSKLTRLSLQLPYCCLLLEMSIFRRLIRKPSGEWIPPWTVLIF